MRPCTAKGNNDVIVGREDILNPEFSAESDELFEPILRVHARYFVVFGKYEDEHGSKRVRQLRKVQCRGIRRARREFQGQSQCRLETPAPRLPETCSPCVGGVAVSGCGESELLVMMR